MLRENFYCVCQILVGTRRQVWIYKLILIDKEGSGHRFIKIVALSLDDLADLLLSAGFSQPKQRKESTMAFFVLALFVVAVTTVLAPLIHAAPKDHLVGNVFFLEGGKQDFLRRSSSDGHVEKDVFYGEDIAAAIAVLLGVPPVMLTPASSAKLDSLLSSNPFKRPHAVFALTIKGVVESLTTKQIEEIFYSSSYERRPFSLNSHQRALELPGKDVVLHLLNNSEHEEDGLKQFDFVQLEQGLEALVSFLDGSYQKEKETDIVTVKIALPVDDGVSISLDLNKWADWKYAVELFSLFQFVQSVPMLQESQQGCQNLAKLFMGTFTALELMDNVLIWRQDAAKLFLYAAVQILGYLEETCNDQIVGVFALSSIYSETTVLPLLYVKESVSSRFLLDDELAPSPSENPNGTLLDAEVQKLIRGTHVLVSSLILILATVLGSCFLVYMPLTRDTLLYSGVKLD